LAFRGKAIFNYPEDVVGAYLAAVFIVSWTHLSHCSKSNSWSCHVQPTSLHGASQIKIGSLMRLVNGIPVT